MKLPKTNPKASALQVVLDSLNAAEESGRTAYEALQTAGRTCMEHDDVQLMEVLDAMLNTVGVHIRSCHMLRRAIVEDIALKKEDCDAEQTEGAQGPEGTKEEAGG